MEVIPAVLGLMLSTAFFGLLQQPAQWAGPTLPPRGRLGDHKIKEEVDVKAKRVLSLFGLLQQSAQWAGPTLPPRGRLGDHKIKEEIDVKAKRVLSLFLALMMFLGLSVPAMAAGGATRLDLVKLLVEYVESEKADGADLAFQDCADLSQGDKSAIATAVAQNWIKGTSETTFSPNAPLLRVQAAMVLDRIIPKDKRPGEKVTFTDIEGSPGKESIEALGGIVTGTSATTFSPDTPISRADLDQWLKNAFPTVEKPADGRATRLDLVKLLVEYVKPEEKDGAGLAFQDCADLSDEDKSAIATAVAQGWIRGTGETTFSPNDPLPRWQAALLLDRVIPKDKRPGEKVTFTDIKGNPAKGSIEALGGIITGTSATTFSPDTDITRADLEQWLKNAFSTEEKPAESGGSGRDWQASSWAKDEVEKADQMGLIPESLVGQDLTKPINRAEFAAVSVKVYEALSGDQAKPAGVNPFTDCDDTEVLKAYDLGITNGSGGDKFLPADPLSREQAATMLTRTFKRVTMPGWSNAEDAKFPLTFDMPALFTDDGDISAWARDSVYFMSAHDIIKGGEGKFMPRAVTAQQEADSYGQATREESLLIAVRMVEKLGK